MLASIIADAPPPIETLKPDVPAGFGAIIRRCLAKARDDRYADVGELARALAPFAPPEAQDGNELGSAQGFIETRIDGFGSAAFTASGFLHATHEDRIAARRVLLHRHAHDFGERGFEQHGASARSSSAATPFRPELVSQERLAIERKTAPLNVRGAAHSQPRCSHAVQTFARLESLRERRRAQRHSGSQ